MVCKLWVALVVKPVVGFIFLARTSIFVVETIYSHLIQCPYLEAILRRVYVTEMHVGFCWVDRERLTVLKGTSAKVPFPCL